MDGVGGTRDGVKRTTMFDWRECIGMGMDTGEMAMHSHVKMMHWHQRNGLTGRRPEKKITLGEIVDHLDNSYIYIP